MVENSLKYDNLPMALEAGVVMPSLDGADIPETPSCCMAFLGKLYGCFDETRFPSLGPPLFSVNGCGSRLHFGWLQATRLTAIRAPDLPDSLLTLALS